MEYSEAKKLVKARLSEKRWTHTKNVKKMAVKLARRWGTDPEKAAMAAILHDSAKELPKQELLQIFADNAIIAENAPARPLPVWHGIAAAILADNDIFGAKRKERLDSVSAAVILESFLNWRTHHPGEEPPDRVLPAAPADQQ